VRDGENGLGGRATAGLFFGCGSFLDDAVDAARSAIGPHRADRVCFPVSHVLYRRLFPITAPIEDLLMVNCAAMAFNLSADD